MQRVLQRLVSSPRQDRLPVWYEDLLSGQGLLWQGGDDLAKGKQGFVDARTLL